MVLVYVPDGRYYVTEEVDLPRRWFRLWREWYVLRETTTLDVEELRRIIEAAHLDPGAWRTPTEEEKRPQRET
jgi:hypothetical protein